MAVGHERRKEQQQRITQMMPQHAATDTDDTANGTTDVASYPTDTADDATDDANDATGSTDLHSFFLLHNPHHRSIHHLSLASTGRFVVPVVPIILLCVVYRRVIHLLLDRVG